MDMTRARTSHRPRRGLRRLGVIVAALAFASGVVGCGPDTPDVGTPAGGETSTPSGAAGAEDLHIVTTDADVRFFGACGNETLEYDGVTYYPPSEMSTGTRETELDDVDLSRYFALLEGVDPAPLGSGDGEALDTAAPVVLTAQITSVDVTLPVSPPALPPSIPLIGPGPGDDVGTLTIFSDGMAHFESEPGLTWWLHKDFAGNDWDC